MIRVMVVEDHEMVRAALVTLLRMVHEFEVVAEAKDGQEAVAQFHLHTPDVIVMDLRLPRISGIEVVRLLFRGPHKARCIVLSAHASEEEVYRAVQAGARGYLLKGSTNSELIEAVRAVHEGEMHFGPGIAAILATRVGRDALTSRETDILKNIVEGMTNKKIAKLHEISEATVKAHVNSLLTKLGVADRTHAATTAIQRGIVMLDPRPTAGRPEATQGSHSTGASANDADG